MLIPDDGFAVRAACALRLRHIEADGTLRDVATFPIGENDHLLATTFGDIYFAEGDRMELGRYLRRLATFVDGGSAPERSVIITDR